MAAATDGWPEQDTAEAHGSAATPREPADAPMRTGDEQEDAGAKAIRPAASLTIYLDEIGAVSLLTPSQEMLLGAALARGRAVRDRLAKREVSPAERDATSHAMARSADNQFGRNDAHETAHVAAGHPAARCQPIWVCPRPPDRLARIDHQHNIHLWAATGDGGRPGD